MEDGDVGNNKLVIARFLDEGIRLRDGQRSRFTQRVPRAGRFGVSIIQWWQAQNGQRMHP